MNNTVENMAEKYIQKKTLNENVNEALKLLRSTQNNEKKSKIPGYARKLAMKYSSAGNDVERMNCIAALSLLACAVAGTQGEQQNLIALSLKLAGSGKE